VHEVELVLLVVVVEARRVAWRHHDRVHAEGRYAKALADLAKAMPLAKVVEMPDRVALSSSHLLVVRIHPIVSFLVVQ
jgi:hypothetical protein